MKKIFLILSLFAMLLYIGCEKTPTDSPFSYNAIIQGFIQFEEASPDTLTATVQAYKTGVSTLMGEENTDTTGYFKIGNL